jgi:DUSP domain
MTSTAFRDKVAQDYVEEAKEVYKLLREEQDSKGSSLTTPDKPGYFYMVSNSWLDAFKKKTSFRDLEDDSTITANDIDMNVTMPTMNEDLIDRDKCRQILKVQNLIPEFAWLDIALKYGLTENYDYILVKEKLWKYLKSCYPGSVEIKRARFFNHMHEECAEIYLIPVTCTHPGSLLLLHVRLHQRSDQAQEVAARDRLLPVQPEHDGLPSERHRTGHLVQM